MSHVYSTSPISHISLCAGYGGIDLGLQRAVGAIRTILFSEIEAFACANLVSKMEAGLLDAAPIWTDLKTLPWDQFRGKVDIVSGGFPCQPFSAAGKRQGDEDPRHLFPYILDGIGRCRPSIVFLENVEGILSAKLAGDNWRDPAGTPVLLHVLRELERVGYKATAGVFSASEVGAPHQRKRVFILALSSSFGGQTGIPRQEQGHEGITGIADNGGGQGEQLGNTGGIKLHGLSDQQWSESLEAWQSGNIWPSRPGEPQHEWEPPRVVGTVCKKLADFCTRDSQQGGDSASTGGSRASHWEQSENAMPDCGSSLRGGDQGNEPPRVVSNSICIRLQNSTDEQVLEGEGGCQFQVEQPGDSADLGNATRTYEHKPCGNGEELSESWDAGSSVGNAAEQGSQGKSCGELRQPKQEQESERSDGEGSDQRQTQPSMGGNPDGTACGLDYAVLQDSDHADCGAGAEHGGELGNSEHPRSYGAEIRGSLDSSSAYKPIREIQTIKPSGASESECGEDIPGSKSDLYTSCDNRTDELRLLGNGVVPATAELAFRTLWEELTNE